jgi:hypothetical protein
LLALQTRFLIISNEDLGSIFNLALKPLQRNHSNKVRAKAGEFTMPPTRSAVVQMERQLDYFYGKYL